MPFLSAGFGLKPLAKGFDDKKTSAERIGTSLQSIKNTTT
jgi:hypothetical protein